MSGLTGQGHSGVKSFLNLNPSYIIHSKKFIQEIFVNMQAHTIEKIDGHQKAFRPIVKQRQIKYYSI